MQRLRNWLGRIRLDGNRKLIKQHSGIRLDIGCGANKQPGFLGMDMRDMDEVDIVHNWNVYPWPLPNESCILVMASHVVEHVSPVDGGFLRWMDEAWRILKVGGELAIACPHGSSQGYLQDPSHCNPCNEATWAYFDPSTALYTIYRPKPWSVKMLNWNPITNIEVVLVKSVEEEDNGEDEGIAV